MLLTVDIHVRLFGYLEGYLLIKCHISTDLNLSLSRNVDAIILQSLIVANEHALLPRRFHLCPFLLRYMDIHWVSSNDSLLVSH